jgi:GcrA cell cycle regulator
MTEETTEETMLRDPGSGACPCPEPPAEAARLATRCTFMGLTSRTCRWPIGDPKKEDFCFCGATPTRGRPYCGFHVGIAYAPPQRR